MYLFLEQDKGCRRHE